MAKHHRVEQATDDSVVQGHCMQDLRYKHTLRICNTYYLSTATIVARTHLNVVLHISCMSC